MAIFRGVGGSGDSSDNSFLDAVTAQANAASASATSAANSLAAIQETEVTSASFDTSDGVLTLTKTGGATVTADLDGRFLTSYTETNDLSTAVTWADVPDANITQSSVTQHQAALSITESQISNLQTYLTAETNDLSTSVTWATVPDAYISSSSVSQHTTGKADLSGATFTGNISFGDSNKINLGADNDLQIYHDGSHSYIDEQGTGDLIVKGLSNIKFQRADTGTDMFMIRPNRVETYDGSGNLITKVDVDGLDVTGELSATDTITAPNVDISTTGSVTTNIATGNHDNTASTKTLNLGTGFAGFFAGLTTVNIGTQSTDSQNTVNIGSGVSTLNKEDTINLKGNVTVDGTLNGAPYEKVKRTRFLKRGYLSTSTINTLTTSLSRIGDLLETKSSDGSENELEFSMGLQYSNTYGTNDGVLYVTVTAPTPSDEDTVTLGTVTSVTTSGGLYTIALSGDVTKHLSPYCGMSVNSDGSSAFGFNNNQSWYYYSSNNTTYITMYAYQAYKPTQGDTVYLHPFDWESSGTEILGTEYQFDKVVYNASLMFREYQNVYLGYFKSNLTVQVKAKEVTQVQGEDGTTILVRSIEGKITQTES